jgi:chemotaxis protein methyltransferase CheR
MRITSIEEIPSQILSSPALLYLFHRVGQILGIKSAPESLEKFNDYLEEQTGATFIKNPGAFERALISQEHIFAAADFLTVNETYFFREGAHFNLLMRQFLPQLASLNRPIQICSAASSIGCEAFSLAMLLDFYAKNKGARSQTEFAFDFRIDAFDISASAIETAKNARYTANTLRTDGAEWKYILDSYLIKDGAEYAAARALREKVNFFTHNIMDSIGKQYDVIFFRNAMIYFSQENRRTIMDNLAESLVNDGILFLGITETSSVRHPLLINRYVSDVFYFQKISPAFYYSQPDPAVRQKKASDFYIEEKHAPSPEPASAPVQKKENKPPISEQQINCKEVAAILEKDEGAPNAQKVLQIITNEKASDGVLTGNELAAAVTTFLGSEDFASASNALTQLEKRGGDGEAVASFLRGECDYLCGRTDDAEKSYADAAAKDKAFWPAFYRISAFAANGNRTLYEYQLKKACESLELGKKFHYECFMGGFSPDYFLRILEKKLA